MFSIKVRYQQTVRRTRINSLEWIELLGAVQSLAPDCANHTLICNRPLEGLKIRSQADLDLIGRNLQGSNLIDISIEEDHTISLILRGMLDMPGNRQYTLDRMLELKKQNTTLTVPDVIGPVLKQDLEDLIQEAMKKFAERKAFKLVYQKEGGMQRLRPVPAENWINYSTASLKDLSKSLSATAIKNLNKNKSWLST